MSSHWVGMSTKIILTNGHVSPLDKAFWIELDGVKFEYDIEVYPALVLTRCRCPILCERCLLRLK